MFNKKKVLFVVDDKKIGGVSSLLSDILIKLDFDKDIKVDLLILNEDGTGLSKLKSNINVIYGTKEFDYINLPFKNLLQSKQVLKAFKKLYLSILMKLNLVGIYIKARRRKLNIEKKYDLEIAFKAGFCTIFTAYGNSKRKINWIHEDYRNNDSTKRYRRLFNRCLKVFEMNVLVSEGALNSFKKIYPHITKTKVIENYINTEKIIDMSNDYSPESEKIVFDKEKTNIISVGRLCKEKGYDRTLQAMIKLKEEGLLKKQIQIHIIALDESVYGNNLIYDWKKSNIYEIKIYKAEGQCNYYPKIKEADLFLMSSRSESFGMVMVESMILGTPVIATKLAASESILGKDNQYGDIIDNSTDGIYEAIKMIIQDKDKSVLKKYRENLKEYSYDKRNKKILDSIKKTLEV